MSLNIERGTPDKAASEELKLYRRGSELLLEGVMKLRA
jgi:hypothetical protein